MESTIEPPGKFTLGVRELWQFRELFYFFTWRDIKVKYKQAVLGIAWALLQPLAMMLILALLFTSVVGSGEKPDLPYPLFLFSGLLIWNLFSSGVSGAAGSMVGNSHIIKKIYFPRLIVPASAILSSLFDFIIGTIIFAILLIYYNRIPDLRILAFVPASLLITLMTTLGLGCWLAALNIKYRDFRYIVPFLTQLLFFLTPVILPTSYIPIEPARLILEWNPLSGAIELLRAPLIYSPVDYFKISISMASASLLFMTGIYFFRKTEHYFADLA